jgi:hypothetical protein
VLLLTLGGLSPSSDGVLSPSLPSLRAHMDRGTVFTNPHGLAAPFHQTAAVALSGRMPGALRVHAGGFPAGGPTLPLLAHREGWAVGVATSSTAKLTRLTTGAPTRVVGSHADPAKVVAKAVRRIFGPRWFVWVHLDLAAGPLAAHDRAIRTLLDAVARQPGARVLVVGLAPDRPGSPPSRVVPGMRAPGGPIALLGDGVPRRTVRTGVSLFDVYPTLLELTQLSDDPGRIVGLAPAPGRSLLAGGDRPVLTGWLGARQIVAATDARAAVAFDLDGRGFDVVREGGATAVAEDAAAPPDIAAHLELLRDRLVAPRLARRNLLLRWGRIAAPPPGLAGAPAVISDALHVLGCTQHELVSGLLVNLYLRHGERLAPRDLLEVRLKSASAQVTVLVEPLDGAYPFGTWREGELVTHPLVFDRGLIGDEGASLWVAVSRGGERLPITEGEGISRDAAPVCNVE